MGETSVLNFLKKLKYLLLELKDLGPVGSIYRIGYETGWRSGLYEFLEIRKSIKHLKTEIDLTFSKWKKFKRSFFVDGVNPQIKSFLKNLPLKEQYKIVEVADQSLKGNIFCFSKWFADYGEPINWHLNPVKNIEWPNNIHWSKVFNYENGGDIKLVWEVNRFPQIYYLVRAWYLTGEEKYVSGSLSQIKQWSEQNHFLQGVNWASGQELAIRIFAWLFALYNFYDHPEFREEDFKLLIKQIYLHTQHIDHSINYAYYAVHNNHLIGEALALYVIGILFPQLPEAKKWEKKGKRILTQKSPQQYYSDGGYCQLSHNYHRLAIHYYLWAIRIAELNNDDFEDELKNMILKSADLLYQNMNLQNGQLPNWGNNDGALLNPWTACDYSDFRPVVQAAFSLCGQLSPFESGPWDEETLWLTGAIISNRIKQTQKSSAFEKSGLYVLRNSEKDFCVFRCGTAPDRFGQADQLHVDLFWDGVNVLTDGGSYLYNDELQFHRYFMGTGSHNTIVIDDQYQMLLWRRFKWLFKTKALIIDYDMKNRIVSGYHNGYERIEKGLIHTRNVKFDSEYLLVKDQVYKKKKQKCKIQINWHVDAFQLNDSQNDDLIEIQFQLKNSTYYLYHWTVNQTEKNKSQLILKNGYSETGNVGGWISRYYGQKKNVYLVQFESNIDQDSEFISLFSKKQLSPDERQACVFF